MDVTVDQEHAGPWPPVWASRSRAHAQRPTAPVLGDPPGSVLRAGCGSVTRPAKGVPCSGPGRAWPACGARAPGDVSSVTGVLVGRPSAAGTQSHPCPACAPALSCPGLPSSGLRQPWGAPAPRATLHPGPQPWLPGRWGRLRFPSQRGEFVGRRQQRPRVSEKTP